MRRYLNRWMGVMLVAMVPALATPALAQTCTVSITDMSFGPDVDTLTGSATDTTATIAYNCTGGSTERVLICVYLGEGSVPASGNRRMSDGSNNLSYDLYSNTERSVIWGSGGSGSPPPPIIAQLAGGTDSGQALIYGRMFGGQSSAPPASYASMFSGGDVNVLYRVTQDSDCTTPSGTQAASSSFNVTATVAKECLVTTAPVSFGAHGVLKSNVDAEGTVNVRCTPATDYSIRLDGGDAAASPTARRMSKGAATITYGLYRNGARDQPWGDTEGATVTGTGNGTEQPHVVYGRVPPQTTPAPGLYADTVIVTVDYD
jgi:spore coat protein U-like protein